MRILIVDTLTHTREHLKTFLELHEGLEVVGEASNGVEALRLSELLLPDIVILDANLPDIDSLEVTQQLTASTCNLAVLLLPLYSEDLNEEAAFAAGAQACVEKSAGVEPIIEAILAQADRQIDQDETQS